MALKRKIRELQKKREQVLLGGGEKAMKKQVAMGKLTARERIIAILDKNSFHEYIYSLNMNPMTLTWTKKYFMVMV